MAARLAVWCGTIAVLGLASAAPTLGQDEPASDAGEEGGGIAMLFEKVCYSCHNIGGGDKTGPDLKDVTTRRDREWLRQFIPSAKDMKKSGDPDAIELFEKFAPEEMADQLLTEEQIDQILDMIEELSTSGQIFIPESGKLSREPTEADIPIGRRLFTGESTLDQGGPACIGCHTVTDIGCLGGGTLGDDLTNANQKYNEVELASILKIPSFETMSKLFADHELTDEEVVQVYAFLQSVKDETPDQGPVSARLVVSVVAGLAILICGTSVLWRGRSRGVRRQLRKGGR